MFIRALRVLNFGRFFIRMRNDVILRKEGIIMMSKPKINGGIIIRNKGRIELGENVLINNTSEYNPVGLPHPTILCTSNKKARIHIGNNVGISGASLVAASFISIGDRTLIGGGVGIWDTDFHPLNSIERRNHQTRGARSAPIVIKEDVFVGSRALILKGVTIGKGAVIGAGAAKWCFVR